MPHADFDPVKVVAAAAIAEIDSLRSFVTNTNLATHSDPIDIGERFDVMRECAQALANKFEEARDLAYGTKVAAMNT